MFLFRKPLRIIVLSLMITAVFLTPLYAATATYERSDNGVVLVYDDLTLQLVGANGVEVDGTIYNVRFIDGVGEKIIPESEFTFTTSLGAQHASQALEDQVYIDVTGLANWDTDPEMTNGIESTTSGKMFTPYKSDNGYWYGGVWNPPDQYIGYGFLNTIYGVGSANDRVAGASPYFAADSTNDNALVYAIWTSVPVPASFLLLISGLTALTAFRKRSIH